MQIGFLSCGEGSFFPALSKPPHFNRRLFCCFDRAEEICYGGAVSGQRLKKGNDESQQCEVAAKLLAEAASIVFLTGAGISKESGIPTFRDAQEGLWEKFSPQELATPQAFEENPRRVREFYEYRREFVRRANPNAGHQAIADLERLGVDVTVITQNVDELHEAAGSTHVIRLHGRIMHDRCHFGCPGGREAVGYEDPICPVCGRDGMRPAVVWFGEALDEDVLWMAVSSVLKADAVVIVGTSGQVYPAAQFGEMALEKAIPVVEINPEPTPFSGKADVFIPLPAARALPVIVSKLR